MPSYVLTDFTTYLSLNPDYDIKSDHRKVMNTHRTRTGAGYRYTWGSYRRCSFKVEDLTSADACCINSWWGADTSLVLYDINSSVVVSGSLVNPSAPIDQFMRPYVDMFMGTIELEGY